MTQQSERPKRGSAMRPTLENWRPMDDARASENLAQNVMVDCGWGRLLFGQTFQDPETLAKALLEETPGRRDIAFYIQDPHVVLAIAPQELFLDPSHSYRLWMSRYHPAKAGVPGFSIRRIQTRKDAEALNTVFAHCQMVQPDADFVYENRDNRLITYFVAVDENSDEIIGGVMGVDHVAAFDDPENGSSLWSLAVDPRTALPGVGEALTRALAEHFKDGGRAYMDLSVIHDNDQAISLYEKLGFERVPIFCIKHKNPVNEPLFVGHPADEDLNPYAQIIVDEARRRGIAVEILDAEEGYFRLSLGGRSITCRESLSDLTTAIAMSRCDNKAVTRRVLAETGITLPAQIKATGGTEDVDFLKKYKRVVVKPARGEQGTGVAVDIQSEHGLRKAVQHARSLCPDVLIEQYVEGHDLRVIVIDYTVVAAAIRRPAEITGTGRHSIEQLIAKQSRRRRAATGGESHIPVDEETERCVRHAGYSMEDVLPEGEILIVRKSANLHTGGTIHDVTDQLHPRVIDAAVTAAKALEIPVVGLDFIVPSADSSEYMFIEANERPGLANHEPQPTAERFIDLLFPETAALRPGG